MNDLFLNGKQNEQIAKLNIDENISIFLQNDIITLNDFSLSILKCISNKNNILQFIFKLDNYFIIRENSYESLFQTKDANDTPSIFISKDINNKFQFDFKTIGSNILTLIEFDYGVLFELELNKEDQFSPSLIISYVKMKNNLTLNELIKHRDIINIEISSISNIKLKSNVSECSGSVNDNLKDIEKFTMNLLI